MELENKVTTVAILKDPKTSTRKYVETELMPALLRVIRGQTEAVFITKNVYVELCQRFEAAKGLGGTYGIRCVNVEAENLPAENLGLFKIEEGFTVFDQDEATIIYARLHIWLKNTLPNP